MLKVPEMKPVQRIQANLLAKAERRALTWMCARLPAWVTPDVLTALGLAGAVMIFAGYALSAIHPVWLWAVVGGFVVHWFGDSLDGSLARFRQIERPDFGYFIDHSTDGLANLLILAGLGLSPFVRLDIALFALAGYLLLSIHAFLAARVVGELRLSYLAAGPTELRLALIAVTLAMFAFGALPVTDTGLTAFDLIVGFVGVVMVILFVVQTLVTTRSLTLK
ncbi:CDP-alcohol phosphatidyltransferase family protein [Sphingomonas sp.]|uniref:CDP-alcohol phosphatidyltransferase family protein n=1 Tax=Sphingomonas sp. TaxID=28214 RepID=UPI002DB62687|nr:CDP-alcohol phosphatidyltransferase family protein [Sphingomonas sp.]HEU4967908.1 CDP-alcohol phosphatidyltransferase family protein [Sphingomonas sp.]